MSSVDDRIVNMQFNNSQFQTGAADSVKSLQTLEQTIGGMGSSSSGLTAMGGQVDQVSTRFGALQVAAVTALATIVNKAVEAGLSLLKSMTLDPLLQGFQEYETNLNSIQTIMANTGAGVKEVGVYLQELNDYSDLTIYNFSQMAQNIGRFTAAGVGLRDATDAIKGLANTAALSGSNVDQLNTAMYQMSQALSTGTIRLMDWNSLANAGMGGENIREALMATTRTLGDNGAAMDEAIKSAGSFRDSLQAGWLTAETFTKTMKVMAGTTLEAGFKAKLTAEELKELGWQSKKAGDTVAFTVEQLKEMGYSDEAAKELNRLSQAAIDSATKVKTFSQLIDVVKESIGSGWAKVFEGLFGNFKEASKLWTGVSETITGAVGRIFGSVNKMLLAWKAAGGYQALWAGFGNIFEALGNLIQPFVDAFQALMPPMKDSGSALAGVTKGFESFTGMLVTLTEGLDILTPVISAVFKAFGFIAGIVGDVVQQLAPVIDLIRELASNMGDLAQQGIAIGKSLIDGVLEGMGITDIRASIENFANSIVEWIKSALGIASPAAALVPVGEAIVLGIAEGIANAVGVLGDALVIVLDAVMELLPVIYMKLLKIPTLFVMALADALPAVRVAMASIIATLLGTIGDAIPEVASLINTLLDSVFNILVTNIPKLASVLTLLTTELLGYLASAIPMFIETGLKILLAIAAGLAAGLPTLATYAGQIIATLADAFIGAIGTLISTISSELNLGLGDSFGQLDWARIFNALIAGGFVVALFKIATSVGNFLNTISGPFANLTGVLDSMQNQLKAQSLLLIATAVGVLVASLVALEVLDAKKLAQNLGIMGGMMASLSATIGILGKMNLTGVSAVGGAMLAIAAGVFILVTALKILESISLRDLAEGVGAIGISMGIFVASLKSLSALGAGLPQAAAGIAIMAGGMLLMAMALRIMAQLDIGDITGSLVTMAVGLSIMVGTLTSLSTLSGPLAAGAAGIFIISAAMLVLAQALKALGALNLGDMFQSLATMGIALTIMTASLFVLGAIGPSAIAGAAAVFIVAAAMLVLAQAMKAIGALNFGDIAAGLGVMVIALALVIAAGYAASGAALGLIVLAGAALALGLAVAFLGAGLLMGATAFALFAAVGSAGIAVVMAGLTAFMALLPAFASQLALAFVSFIQTIAEMSPRLREAFGEIIKNILGTLRDAIPEIKSLANAIIGGLLSVIAKNIPKYGKVILTLIKTGLAILRQAIPLYVRTGLAIILGVIQGFADGLPKIIRAGTDLIVAFIQGIQQSYNRILNAAGEAVIKFLEGIADTIRDKQERIRNAGLDIGKAIIEGIVDALKDGLGAVSDAVGDLANAAKDKFTDIFSIFSPSKVSHWWGEMIVQGLVNGIESNIENAVGATVRLANAAATAGYEQIAKVQKEAAKRQIIADRKAANARLADQAAKAAEKAAKQSPKNKGLQKAAEIARKNAEEAQKIADKAQKAADAANSRVEQKKAFKDADDQGKGDILTERATALGRRAQQALALANAEAQAAKKLQGKERDRMLRAAQQDAREAKRLANASKQARAAAQKYYGNSVEDRIRAIRETQKAEADALAKQKELDEADVAGKVRILEERAAANQEVADRKQKRAEDLLRTARKLANKDAVKAQRLIDRAEALAAEAKEAADQAKQEQDQAQQVTSQDSTSGSATSFSLSKSAMEDAASAIDRYTKSLQQAEEAAAAATPVYQFVQNNTSPVALTDTEIYRQSKNLLSAAEVKMAVNP